MISTILFESTGKPLNKLNRNLETIHNLLIIRVCTKRNINQIVYYMMNKIIACFSVCLNVEVICQKLRLRMDIN